MEDHDCMVKCARCWLGCNQFCLHILPHLSPAQNHLPPPVAPLHHGPRVAVWVSRRLQEAGAVLVAKLATGEMAYDDVWFDGFTKNPWNIAEGSSGSSAGPAAAVAAGLVPFALGTETGGSITYPANTCGITAHRTSFGLVGRSNIMSLADSLVSPSRFPYECVVHIFISVTLIVMCPQQLCMQGSRACQHCHGC